MKTLTVLIVVEALGLLKKGLEKYINQIPGHVRIEQLQIVLLGSAYILKKTLSIKRTLPLPLMMIITIIKIIIIF